VALNLDEIEPTVGSGLARRTRNTGPNPFLDKGWLENSYNEEQDYDCPPVQGELVMTTVQKGENAGKPAKKWTGDVQTLISLLRSAAEKLEIGVYIQVLPALDARNRERKGWWVVKYMGKEKSERPRRGGGDAPADDEADE